jgi:hypothetical protein
MGCGDGALRSFPKEQAAASADNAAAAADERSTSKDVLRVKRFHLSREAADECVRRSMIRLENNFAASGHILARV